MLKNFVLVATFQMENFQLDILSYWQKYVDGFQGDKVHQVWGTCRKLASLLLSDSDRLLRVFAVLMRTWKGRREGRKKEDDFELSYIIVYNTERVNARLITMSVEWHGLCIPWESTVNLWCGAELLESNAFSQGSPPHRLPQRSTHA